LSTVLKKISPQEAISFAKQKFNIDETSPFPNPDEVYYVKDNILASFSIGNRNGEKNYLLDLKKGLDEMAKKNKDYKSTLKKNENNQVLLISHINKGTRYYDIYASNNNNTHALNASIQFNQSDAAEATKLLNEILAGMNFTK